MWEGGTGMVDVKDVVRCMVQLFNSGISAERFIINAENISYRNLFNAIADLLGKKRPYLHAPPWIAQIAWRTRSDPLFIDFFIALYHA
jgi:nucleoside-diphosphate-sugar epimerase